jgi:phenylalanyl-tRNA synthetase beta chain
MRISTEWLGDFLQPVPPAADAGETLTLGGFPVEEFFTVNGVDAIEVEVTSNRPDLLSHVGVARELAALGKGTFSVQDATPAETAEQAAGVVEVEIDDETLCPHYTARILRGVTIGPSPDWLVRRLEQVGLRPINNVVDVTNYVLYELGQPLHAFDLGTIRGDRIVVRTARDGETLTTLDGFDRKLTGDTLCICDAERPVALAGVMGGLETEVTGGTTDLLLESARFDPLSIRRTSRRLKLMSDSSHRFERGIDPTLPDRASRRAAELILQIAGGALAGGVAEAGSPGTTGDKLSMRWSRADRLVGMPLPREEVLAGFDRLGFSPADEGEHVSVTVPSHRLDLKIEADLIEEAVRVVGYDRIPTRDRISVSVTPTDPVLEATDRMRMTLAACGHFEAVTFSFVSDTLREHFLPRGASLRRVDPNVRKADGHLRPSVLPGLIESIRHNETVGNDDVKLFEIGGIFLRRDESPIEERRLAVAGGEDFAELRGTIEAVLQALDGERAVVVEPASAAGFDPAVCGRVIWGGQPVGHLGRTAPAVVKALGLRHTPMLAELSLEPLLAGYKSIPTNRPLPRFPSASRDVSFVVKETVRYDELASPAQGLEHLVAVEHGGTYRGKPLPKGQKSVTLTLVFRKPDGTVAREDADAQVARFVELVREKTGAQVRS